jgi:hypothetical protein
MKISTFLVSGESNFSRVQHYMILNFDYQNVVVEILK